MKQHAHYRSEDLVEDAQALIKCMEDRKVSVDKSYAVVCYTKHVLEEALNVTNVEIGVLASDEEMH